MIFVGDSLHDALAGQATVTRLGRVYLPTSTELESGEPDAGREGLSIVLPLGSVDRIGPEDTITWIVEVSGDFVIPKDGVYEILAQGGGGGGGGASAAGGTTVYSAGGGSGALASRVIPLAKGTIVECVIGAGGDGGSGSAGANPGNGQSGGTTTATILTIDQDISITATGGPGGSGYRATVSSVSASGVQSQIPLFGAVPAVGTVGGGSIFGPGGQGGSTIVAGTPAETSYGAGAGGRYVTGYGGGPGAPGAKGCVRITRLS